MSLLYLFSEEDELPGVLAETATTYDVDIRVLSEVVTAFGVYGPKLFEAMSSNDIRDATILSQGSVATLVAILSEVGVPIKAPAQVWAQPYLSFDIFSAVCACEIGVPTRSTAFIAEEATSFSLQQNTVSESVTSFDFFANVCKNENILCNNIGCLVSEGFFGWQVAATKLFDASTTWHILQGAITSAGVSDISCLAVNSISSQGVALYSLYDENAAVVYQHDLLMLKGSQSLSMRTCNIGTDKDSYCWSMECTATDKTTYDACTVGSLITVSFQGFPTSTFVIDDRKVTNKPTERLYTITGRSITAKIGDLASTVSNTWENVSAHSIVHELCSACGVSVDVSNMPNWDVRLLEADSMLPVEIINKLAAACGCFLTTVQDTLTILSKYPIPPSKWDLQTPGHSLVDLSSCLEMTDYIVGGNDYTEVIVSDYEDADSFSLSLGVEEKTDTSAIVTMVSHPILSSDTAQQVLTSSHLPTGFAVSYMGEFYETVTEQVEIVNGVGNTTKNIYSLLGFDYKRHYDAGAITVTGATSIKVAEEATTLVFVTYYTHTHKFKVVTDDSVVQLLVTI